MELAHPRQNRMESSYDHMIIWTPRWMVRCPMLLIGNASDFIGKDQFKKVYGGVRYCVSSRSPKTQNSLWSTQEQNPHPQLTKIYSRITPQLKLYPSITFPQTELSVTPPYNCAGRAICLLKINIHGLYIHQIFRLLTLHTSGVNNNKIIHCKSSLW